MANKREKVFARITEHERDELAELAKRLDVPASQIVRDGLRERVAKLQTELAKSKTPFVVASK